MKKHLLLFIFISSFGHLFSQKFVNEFLNIGVGARAHGMSGAVTASGRDGTAAFWNPAGLTRIDHSLQVNAMHAEWFAGIANYDYGSVVKRFDPEKKSVGALSIIRMGIDNIPYTLNLIGPDGSVNYDDVTSFSSVSYAIILSYGRMILNENLRLGASTKIINRSIGPFANAWGIGADVGLIYTKPRYTLGLMGKDITTTYNTWSFNFNEEEKEVFASTGNEIPVSSTEVSLPRLILGGAFHNDQSNESQVYGYTLEANIIVSTDGRASGIGTQGFNIDPAIGGELSYKDLVFIRAGVGNIQRVLNEINAARVFSLQPNVGLGLNLGRIGIDYALTNIGALGSENSALFSHIFSLSINFDPKS